MRTFFLAISALALAVSVTASIYPDGEDKAAWDARINAKIDKLHKRDVRLSVELPEELRGHQNNLRLRINQTRTPVPFGKLEDHGIDKAFVSVNNHCF